MLRLSMPAALETGTTVRGEVCPEAWVQHYYELTEAEGSKDLVFKFTQRKGSLYYMVRPSKPPIKRVPPYNLAQENKFANRVYTATYCAATPGTYYLAMRGTGSCAAYDVTVETLDLDNECVSTAENHDPDISSTVEMPELIMDGFVYGTCTRDSYLDYFYDGDCSMNECNVIFSVEDLERETLNPQALTVSVYEPDIDASDPYGGAIPDDRTGGRVRTYAPTRLYSIAYDATRVRRGRYFLSVRCGASEVSFRISVAVQNTRLVEDSTTLGSVSPDAWVYYTAFDPHYSFNSMPSSAPTAEPSDASDGRRLAGSPTLSPTLQPTEGYRDNSTRTVEIQITLYTGNIWRLAVAMAVPPTFNSNNIGEMDESQIALKFNTSESSKMYVKVCDVPQGKPLFLGLHGGLVTAEFALISSSTRREPPLGGAQSVCSDDDSHFICTTKTCDPSYE